MGSLRGRLRDWNAAHPHQARGIRLWILKRLYDVGDGLRCWARRTYHGPCIGCGCTFGACCHCGEPLKGRTGGHA